jgi:hypothetical protein
MIGRIFDSAGIILAAVLTLCGFLLLFLPWDAAFAPAPSKPSTAPSIVYVSTGAAKKPADARAALPK